jgi:hypothetical protein
MVRSIRRKTHVSTAGGQQFIGWVTQETVSHFLLLGTRADSPLVGIESSIPVLYG